MTGCALAHYAKLFCYQAQLVIKITVTATDNKQNDNSHTSNNNKLEMRGKA